MGKKVRIGRHGLPVKTKRIIFSVTPDQEKGIKQAAKRKGKTVTQHLVDSAMVSPYGWEKFYKSVRGMAVSSGSLQRRIADAWAFELQHINPERDLPEEMRAEFVAMKTVLSAGPDPELKGLFAATLDAMSDDEAWDIAERICDMYDRLEDERSRG